MSYRADKLKIGQILSLNLNLTLKVKINHPRKQKGILTKVFFTYGPNLVNLAWTGDKLSRRKTNDSTQKPKLALGDKISSWRIFPHSAFKFQTCIIFFHIIWRRWYSKHENFDVGT